ncbi:MAG: hypothetical protein JO319_01995 [Acidobacteriaceae bacterium]|nr:hypothetical protein [Acidobacteriaceae bacterium]
MEIDSDLRVIVVADPYEPKCCVKALRSGALDYLQAPLRKEQIYGLLDTFIARGDLWHGYYRRSRKTPGTDGAD